MSAQTYASENPWQAEWPRSQWARDLVYLLLGLPLGIPAFVIAVAGFAAGLGTLVVWLGLPILLATLAASRGFARLERRQVQLVTRRPLPPHHYRSARGSGPARWWRGLLDPQSWRDLLHSVLAFPLRVAAFAIAVAWSVGGLGETLYVLWEWALPRGPGNQTLPALAFGIESRLVDIALRTALGFVLLATLRPVLRGLAALARGLLTNETAALRARAEELSAGRRAAVQAEAQTLRRVERDIHDGPQQRLVRLTMDLEAVSRRLDDDPERARPLVAEALEQSREALSELRAVSRGIAPPVLADRGLGAALAAAAARCPVPVTLDVGLPEGSRLPESVENAGYFLVTEALTNVAKHSGASACSVDVHRDGRLLWVFVTDDGQGGAHLGKGHGLAGLADRLAAVDGTLEVVSPAGGPTTVSGAIPLSGGG